MNFAWHKFRHLIAISITQSIILSQACAVTIGTQPAGDASQLENQDTIAMVSPLLPPDAPGAAVEPRTENSADTTGNTAKPVTDQVHGLRFKISPGKPHEESQEVTPIAETKSLSEAETDKLLNLLPPLVQEKARAFVLPAKSLPPPNKQNRLSQPFPPHEQKPAPSSPVSSPLKVTNKRPVGNVDSSSAVSLSFSQPMVPIATQGFLETKSPPVSMKPVIDGKWKWFGTQTLTFEPSAKRLPMSTSFELNVPEGTTSVNGGKLSTGETWHFSTSTVKLVSSYPSYDTAVRPNTLIMARFNQKIDPSTILESTQILVGKKAFSIVAASQSEIDSDTSLCSQLKGVSQNTFVVFKAASPLPLGTRFTVKIGPNIKSAEGPLLARNSINFQFQTYGAFKVLPQEDYEKTVDQEGAFYVRFSNFVDRKSVSTSTVVVSPSIPDIQIQTDEYIGQITISGMKKPKSTYLVQLKSGLKDIYGQSLADNAQTLKYAVSSTEKQLLISQKMTLLPSGHKANFEVATVNLNAVEMQLFSANPENYANFDSSSYAWVKQHKPFHVETIKIKNIAEQLVSTKVDLGPWLNKSRGSLVVRFTSREMPRDFQMLDWVQATNIGLDVLSDRHSLKAWVTELTTGHPIKDAKVFLAPGGTTYLTDDHGLVTIPLKNNTHDVLLAKHGNDTALVADYDVFRSFNEDANYLLCAVTDRSPYKPGEQVNVKGMLRRRLSEPTAAPTMPRGINNLSYQFVDSLGNEIGKGKCKINKFGGFDLSFKLPQKMNLGDVALKLVADEHAPHEGTFAAYDLSVKVSEFRRPEFELKVKNDGPSVHIIKSGTTLSATTNYFAGGSLAHADINWTASSTSTTYSPPGWSDYLFGKTRFRYFEHLSYSRSDSTDTPPQTVTGTTDSAGKNYLQIDYLDVHPSEPSNLNISATVQDVNRQTWTDSTTLLVHPSELYVGNKLDTVYVKKDAILPMSFIVTNIDGKAVENMPVKIELYRSTEQMVDGKSWEKKDDVQTLTFTSGAKPVAIKLKPKLGGTYQITSSVVDSKGRKNETITSFYSDGGAARAEAKAEAQFDLQNLILLPEKTEYKPGDSAKVLVQSPIFPAEGLATIWHHGLSTSIPFHMAESSYDLQIPIAESDVPSIELQVDILGIDSKNEKTQTAPGEATGKVSIDISTEHKKLTVVANPDVASTSPGKEVSINVDVTDYRGAAVEDAEVTLAVVDDALLSLLNYRFTDPLESFYPHHEFDGGKTLREREFLDMTTFLKQSNAKRKTSDYSSWRSSGLGGRFYKHSASPVPSPMGVAQSLMTTFAKPEASTQFQMIQRESNGAQTKDPDFLMNWGGSSAGKNKSPAVQLRSNFDALAKWAPSVVTDERGHAVVKVKLPDNLTRYRIMAIAAHAETDFGTGESALTVCLPLMVKPSAPRFLNYGDKFELPVVLRNQTDKPIEVDIAARATNVQFTQGQGRHTTIAANDRVEVRMPASTLQSGTARFQVVALSGTDSDAAEFSLPIYTPATVEAFATYGQIENGAIAQSIETPEDVIPDYGSLELTTSTTVLETLTDAFIYLQHYPFECSEQISSRLISVSLLKDMLKEFHAAGVPADEQIAKTVKEDLQKLKSRQHSDGSFALWRFEERETYPYVTLNVAQALILAKKAGYQVDSQMLDKAMRYLKDIDKYINDYKGNARTDLKAMTLYLRDQNGDTDVSAAHTLLSAQAPDKLSLEALGYLLQVFAHKDRSSKDAIAVYTYLNNCIVETSSTAEVLRNGNKADIACSDYRLFDSPSKVKAIMLDSLLTEGKSPEVVTKLMRSLLGGQVKGRWRNTQENAYVLLAMRHYFDKYEKNVPDFTAEAWLGKAFIGGTSFKGRTNDFKTISLPMNYLCDTTARNENLIVQKSGNGRLYYRLGLNYAPKSLHLSSMDRGFNVTRSYEAVTNKDDVQKSSDGTWRFKAGSLVKVKIGLTASSERFFVAMVDPLPAGAESLNQDLYGSESATECGSTTPINDLSGDRFGGWRWWNTSWWNHENKRDNQTEVFADQLWGGTHEYSYLMRATTPGRFVVPPTKAEEMYAPETFGRTATETVVIE